MFECKICNQKFENSRQLLNHLKTHNIKYQDYLKTYIWKSINYYGITITPGICPICNNSVTLNYNNLRIFCSNKCQGIFSKTSKEYKTNIKSKIIETSLEKYGVDNASKSEEKKSLIKQTKLERYGDSNYNNREQAKETCLKKYGESNYNNLKKAKETCLERYGVENPFQADFVKNLTKQTCIEKYGVAHSTQADIIKEKIKETCIKKYGVTSPLKNKKILKKSKQTNLKKYGVDNFTKSDKYQKLLPKIQNKIKETSLKKYGVENASQSKLIKEKVKETCLKKYGTEFYTQSKTYKETIPEIQDKIYKVKKKNHTFNTSEPELKLLKLLQDKFGKSDIKYQYKSELYPFACDFYIKSLDLYIELQGSWTHGSEPFDATNPDHQNKLQIWKSKNTKFYNNAINVWTIRDPYKRKTAKENNLNYIEVFDSIEFSELKDIL